MNVKRDSGSCEVFVTITSAELVGGAADMTIAPKAAMSGCGQEGGGYA